MRRVPSTRRAMATTSWEVTPAGLSTSTTPSIVLVLWSDSRFLLDLREQRLDARRARDALVHLERDLWCETQAQRTPHASAQVTGEAVEPVECRRTILLGTVDAHEHLRSAQVARDFYTGDGDQADNPRIFH